VQVSARIGARTQNISAGVWGAGFRPRGKSRIVPWGADGEPNWERLRSFAGTIRGQLMTDRCDDAPMPSRPQKADITNRGLLSEREQQVAALVCKGLSNKSVARMLAVSEGTIKSHLHAIYVKLGVQSRSELISALGSSQSD
jgi:DNA-binding CsgD family transcriptional regulator